jgi:hypothetical protein
MLGPPKSFVTAAIIIPVVFVTVAVGSCIVSRLISNRTRGRRALDTEAYRSPVATARTAPPTIVPPPTQASEGHAIVQSTGGQITLTLQGGSASDTVRAQQERALAQYANPATRDPRPAAVLAQERRALGRHARNDNPSTSSTSQLSSPVPSPNVPTTSRRSIGEHAPDPDLRAQVRQLQEEVERLRTERAQPLQELPPAYQPDVGSALR